MFVLYSGGPAEPEVEYEVSQDQREILLSWSRPFTWSDYPITGYLIECRDSEKTVHSSVVNDTETVSGAVVNKTVELPSHTPDCYSLNCSVTAYNDLDGSLPSNISIHIPLRKLSPTVTPYTHTHSYSLCLFLGRDDLQRSHHICPLCM